MRAVELFAGIGGFRLATDRAGHETVFANDLSAKACAVYRAHFGRPILREGDFAGMRTEVPAHDLLTGGFPCQPFSSAGKKAGVRDARGTLFEHIVETLKAHRPRFFVLENVKRLLTMERGRHFATILGALVELDYFVEWRLLNAVHFGLPQNRERVFIVGRLASGPKYRPPAADFSPIGLATPDDLRMSDERRLGLFDPSRWRSVEAANHRFENWGIACRGRFFTNGLDSFSEASDPVRLESVLEKRVGDEFDFTESTLKWLPDNTPVNRFVHGVEILSNQKGGARMGYTIFGTRGIAPTLTSTTSRHYERYKIGERYRRLTNVEYARIQGFADDHCSELSVYDQYALLGNAVPPPMAEWVIRRLGAGGISLGELSVHSQGRGLFDHVR